MPEVWRLGGAGWDLRAPMLTARGGCASAVLDGRIYVLGGEGAPNASGVFAEVEAYQPSNDVWTIFEPMLTPRHGTGAATVGDTIYVPGGATVEGFGFVDTVEAFTPGMSPCTFRAMSLGAMWPCVRITSVTIARRCGVMRSPRERSCSITSA